MELLGEAKSTVRIAYDVGISERAALAHLVRMYHLGIVQPIAIETWERENNMPASSAIWEMTEHSRSHKAVVSGCFGCKMRMIYLVANEALIE